MIRAVIAYRAGEPSRVRPFLMVRDWLRDVGLEAVVVCGDGGHPFNAGHAKNQGVRLSPGPPDDVLLLCDADCIATLSQVREASWLALQEPGVVFLGDSLRVLDRESLSRVSGWETAAASLGGELRPGQQTPQCYALRRDCFSLLGGYDEGYVGYGFEDYDFLHRAGRLWPHRAAPGTVVHLWHEPDPEKAGGPLLQANERRYLESVK